MRQNFLRLHAAFEERGPNWPELAAAFAQEGLVDFRNKPATLRCAQQTWYRVKRDMTRLPEPLGRDLAKTSPLAASPVPANNLVAQAPSQAPSDRPRPVNLPIPARSIHRQIDN